MQDVRKRLSCLLAWVRSQEDVVWQEESRVGFWEVIRSSGLATVSLRYVLDIQRQRGRWTGWNLRVITMGVTVSREEKGPRK